MQHAERPSSVTPNAAAPARIARRAVTHPAWIGIGAQRCGTTWFADLLCRHPQVSLAVTGKKEIHYFDRFAVDPWTEAAAGEYRELFDPDLAAGEFTPAYLRSLWVPPLLRAACRGTPLIVAILRDPVERFASAMRWEAARRPPPPRKDVRAYRQWARLGGNSAQWGGMYASQLDLWARHFPPERIVVLQYETLREDPRPALARVWRALRLDPVDVETSPEPTWNSTRGSAWSAPPGLIAQLRVLYAPEVAAVAARWGIDPALWPHFV